MHSLRRQRNFMNTEIVLEVAFDQARFSTVEVSEALEQGFGEFDRIVAQFTRFNHSSELAHLNRSSGDWYEVSPEMFKLVTLMLEMAYKTGGAFDPTIIDFLEMYGYDAKYDFSKLDNPNLQAEIAKLAAERPSWREIALDKANLRIRLAKNQRLDLGGIGKGYAIDCASVHLEKFGNYLIDAGGDLRLLGRNKDNEPWRVGLKHRHEGQDVIIKEIASEKLSLACSGSWSRRVKNFHHILSPQSGEPSESAATVYVAADDATTADTWATALMVNPSLGRTALAEVGGGFMIISAAGAVTSAGEIFQKS
jgi:thiamine biosynthesis lipoprotein